MNKQQTQPLCIGLLAISGIVTGAFLSGCGKSEVPVSKSESAQIHAPLGQPMPPEARAAMAKAMSKVPAGPPPAATK